MAEYLESEPLSLVTKGRQCRNSSPYSVVISLLISEGRIFDNFHRYLNEDIKAKEIGEIATVAFITSLLKLANSKAVQVPKQIECRPIPPGTTLGCVRSQSTASSKYSSSKYGGRFPDSSTTRQK